MCSDDNGSDHLHFDLETDATEIEPQWLWTKANWQLFQSVLDKNLRISKPDQVTTKRVG